MPSKKSPSVINDTLYSRVFHNAHAPLCITDAEGSVSLHNAAFARLAGRPGSDLTGQQIASLFAAELLRPWLNRSRRAHACLQFGWPASLHHGGHLDGHCHIDRIDEKGETPTYFWSFGFPNPHEEFRAFCQSLQSLTKGAQIAMIMIDAEEKLLFYNDIFRSMGFLRRPSASGTPLQQAFKPAVYVECRAGIQSAREGRDDRYEFKLMLERKTRWFTLSFIPVRFGGGKKSIIMACLEITQQKQLENDYQLSHHINKAFAEKWPHAIVSLNAKGILFANPAARQILGDPEESGSNAFSDVIRANQGIRALRRKLKKCLWEGAESGHFEHVVSLPNGDKKIIDVHYIRSLIADQPVLASSWVDITELRQIQQDFAHRVDELAILNEIAAQTSESLDLDVILRSTLRSVMKSIGSNVGLVFLLDDSPEPMIKCVHYRGFTKAETERLTPQQGQRSFTQSAIKENMVFFVENVHEQDVFPPVLEVGITSFVIIPIFIKNKPLGTMNLGRRGEGKLRLLSMKALKSIGNQIGMAIENARLLHCRDREIAERHKIETDLRQSEALYRQIISTSPESVVLMDMANRFLVVNDAFAELFGYADAPSFMTFIENWPDYPDAETTAILADLKKSLLKHGRITNRQIQINRRDRSLATLELSASLIRDENHRPQAMLGIIRDITKRMAFESALRESEARYRALAEAAHDMIFIIDQDDKVAYVNRFSALQFNVKPHEIIGKDRTELFGAETSAHQKHSLIKVFKSGQPLYVENVANFPQRTVWLGTWLVPLPDAAGKVTQVLGVSRDITAIKESAQRLEVSEQRFRDIIERSLDGYYFVDAEGFIRTINRSFCDILQVDCESFMDQPYYEMVPVRYREAIRTIFMRVKSGKNVYYDDFELAVPGRKTVWLSYNARRVVDAGRVIGIEGFIRDITEQVTTYERLRALSLRLVQVQEEERRRIAREIHDSLGQYLTAVQLEVEAAIRALGSQQEIPKALRDAHKTIEESIMAASTLCYALRPPLLDDFGLIVALKDYFKEFTTRWHIEVSFQPEEMGRALGKDGETALFRVSQEALTNVLKHARATQVKVFLERAEGQVILTIEDNGIGFDPEEAPHQAGGAHFGLLTMKERVELLDGTLNIRSRANQGTVITAAVPTIEGAG